MQVVSSPPFVHQRRPILYASLATCVPRGLTLTNSTIYQGHWALVPDRVQSMEGKSRRSEGGKRARLRVFLPCLLLFSPTVLVSSSLTTAPVRQLFFQSLSSQWAPEILFLPSSLQSQETASHCFWSLGASIFPLDPLNPACSYVNCPFTKLPLQFQLSMPKN